MASSTIQLYLAETTWVAGGADPADVVAGALRADDDASWASLAQVLRGRFASQRAVHVVLSARRCRFLVAPWATSCFTGHAIRAYVVQLFAELQDVSETTHHIEIDWPAYGEPILAAAYPRDTLEALRRALADSGFALVGVVPSIAPVLRKFAGKLHATGAVLAYAEDDGVTGLTLDAGHIVQVEALAAHADGLEDTALWLTRKRFAFADDLAVHWLLTGPAPDGFSGTALACGGATQSVSPGHALLEVARP